MFGEYLCIVERSEKKTYSLVVDQPPGVMKFTDLAVYIYEDRYGQKIRIEQIKYEFSEGSWNGIHYPRTEFIAFVPCDLRQRLREAFNAGHIFKLRLKPKGMGEIIWGDIPHQTTLKPPDREYLEEMDKALKAKGF